jgi:SAM-dependent methyltransferase
MPFFPWRHRARGAVAEAEPTTLIGNRRHTVGLPYALPTDLEETNRLDFQHYLLRYAFQGNYAAPIGQPASILDVGSGTGRWAREMAATFPATRVVGLDVAPPPADDASAGQGALPSNYTFQAGNVLEGLPFADQSFDFVHMRLLFLALPRDRWPFVVAELARVTRLGGWVESVEAGLERDGGPAMDLLLAWGTEACARRGIDVHYGARVGELLRAAGLTGVTAREVTLPLGANGGRTGHLMSLDFFTGIRALGNLAVAQGITTQAEFEATVQAAQADTDSAQFRCLAPFHIAFGQRVR